MSLQLLTPDPSKQAMLDAGALHEGELQVVPAAFYRMFEQEQLSAFCLRHGLYCLPTTELLDEINRLILAASPARNAIEIGSGHGTLGKGLGIPCTDSRMQEDPTIRQLYASAGQPPVVYGEHVITLDALAAVKRYRPEVVVAAWVTHRYSEAEAWREGNMFGVDELTLLRQVRRYVFVGNYRPHRLKPLLDHPHQVIRGDYLFSRSRAEDNVMLVWDELPITNS